MCTLGPTVCSFLFFFIECVILLQRENAGLYNSLSSGAPGNPISVIHVTTSFSLLLDPSVLRLAAA